MTVIRTDGPGNAAAVLVLGHGTRGSIDDPPLGPVAIALSELGIDVVRFEFPFLVGEDSSGEDSSGATESDAVLAECFEAVVRGLKHPGTLFVGGYSLGARMATTIAERVGAGGVCCISYPFHPVGEPLRREAVALLRQCASPVLIVQGSRDAFGNREQVRGYDLSSKVELEWLPDANHGLIPRQRSGFTLEQHMATTVRHIEHFIQARLACR